MLGFVQRPASYQEEVAPVCWMPAPGRLGDVRPNRGGRADQLRTHGPPVEERPVLDCVVELMSQLHGELVRDELRKFDGMQGKVHRSGFFAPSAALQLCSSTPQPSDR